MSTADTTPPPNNDSATQLGKIVVEAPDLEPVSPKFTAPQIDTPISLTILTQSVMQETAAISLQDALRNVPGITFAAGEGGTPTGDLPSIRGFNAAGSVYVDSMRDIGVQTRDIFDVEQVEVVKGPDSTIAGRSAGGGAINLVTKTARAEDFVEATGMYGTAGQWRTTLDGNIKITDSIAARLNFMDMGGGVPGRNSAVRTDKWGIAPTITFGLQTSTRLILNYYHYEDKSTPDYGIPVDYSVTGQPLSVTQGISTSNYYGLSDRDFRKNPIDSGSARLEHEFSDSLSLRSQLRYTLSENQYVLTLPYQATDADYNIEPGLVYRLPIGNDDMTHGIVSQTDLFGHFNTGAIRHDVDFGFEASQEKERLLGGGSWLGYTVTSPNGLQGYNGGDCSQAAELASYDCTSLYNPNPRDPWKGSVVPNYSEIANFTTRDYAPYVFDTMTLTPQLKLNAGARWDRYNTAASDPVNPADFSGTDQESFTSYQIGLMYKPLENGTVYVTNSSASIPEPEASSGAGQDQSYPGGTTYAGSAGHKPEITHSIEVGTKWNLFGNRLLVSGDIFKETHANALIYLSPDTYSQAGKTRVEGYELSANGSITEDWNIIAGFSHLDANVLEGGLYQTAGHHLPNTPPNTFSLWSTYRPIPALTLGGGAYFVDKEIGYSGPPDEYINQYWRFDAMGKWQVDKFLSVQLNVQNILNRQYFSKDFYWYALPAPGRIWLVTGAVKLY